MVGGGFRGRGRLLVGLEMSLRQLLLLRRRRLPDARSVRAGRVVLQGSQWLLLCSEQSTKVLQQQEDDTASEGEEDSEEQDGDGEEDEPEGAEMAVAAAGEAGSWGGWVRGCLTRVRLRLGLAPASAPTASAAGSATDVEAGEAPPAMWAS